MLNEHPEDCVPLDAKSVRRFIELAAMDWDLGGEGTDEVGRR